MAWVTVHVSYTRPDAELIAAILRGSGIEALVASDDAGTMGPELAFSNGVHVRVMEKDRLRAVEIVRASDG